MGAASDGALPDVFEGFYEAALAPEQWRAALAAAARAIDAAGVSMIASAGVRVPSVQPEALDEMAADYMASGWFAHNDRFGRCFEFLQQGGGFGRSRIMTNDSVFADDPAMEHLAIQQEFFGRHDIGAFAGSASLAETPHGGVFMSIDRWTRQGSFTSGEVERIDLIGQHLKRALRIVLLTENASWTGAADGLNAIGSAAVFVGANLRVVGLNNEAEAFIGKGLRITGGVLSASDPRSQPGLDRLIGAVVNPDFTAMRELPGPVLLKRGRGRPLIVRAVPFRSNVSPLFRAARAIVLISDPDHRPGAMPEAALRDLFGLTPAEARLAAALASGASLEICAKAFDVSYATVRNQLGSIFGKTGVKRQTDLVALLQRLGSGA